MGEYPDDLSVGSSPLLMAGGRVIPTTPWEAIWNGISQWFGVTENQLDDVLPLRKNFPSNRLFIESDLFEDG